MKISRLLRKSSDYLKLKKIPNPVLDSEILMSKVLKIDRKNFILNQDIKLKDSQYEEFNELISQRSFNKPIAYIIKKKDFWNKEFFVNEQVLIPRPDSEILIEEALRLLKYRPQKKILDIGVGSGGLILSLLSECKEVKGVGIDINLNALKVCKFNAKKLNLNKRISLYKSDIDKFNLGKYDIIISNPPYICKSDLRNLIKDVLDYEPLKALDGGIDGMSEIKKVIKKASKLIKNKGKLLLEIAHDQKMRTIKLLNKYDFYVEKTVKDYSKNDRCIVSTKI